MTLSEVITLGGACFGSGGAAVGILFIVALLNLDRIISVWRWMAGKLYRILRIHKRQKLSQDISAKINSSLFRLRKESPTAFGQSVSVKWLRDKESFSQIRDGEVVLYVREDQGEDSIHADATMLFLKDSVIAPSRMFIERKLLKAIDVTLAQRMLSAYPRAYEHLQTKYVDDLLKSHSQQELYALTESLQEAGVLTRIVLLEFGALGNKLRGTSSTSRTREETVNFARFVQRVVNRDGDYVPLKFCGRLFSTTVALVADPVVAGERGIVFYKNRFRFDIQSGTRIIHMLARGTRNVQFARTISAWAKEQGLISGATQGYFYDPTSVGNRIPCGCITCISNQTPHSLELSPTDEVYGALGELFPAVLDGSVEVMSVAREDNIRTKIVVRAKEATNPVGYFVGSNGENISKLKELLSTSEEIDIIHWSIVPDEMVTRALYPLREDEISDLIIDRDKRTATVILKDKDLIGLVIGRNGVNIKLARQVSGYQIEVKSVDELIPDQDQILELLQNNIPRVATGDLEIVDIARDPGKLTKVAMKARNGGTLDNDLPLHNDKRKVAAKLNERVHFVQWSEDPLQYAMNALLPSQKGEVSKVESEGTNPVRVTIYVITDQTLREAIGQQGVNVKLAERLTNTKISVKVSNE